MGDLYFLFFLFIQIVSKFWTQITFKNRKKLIWKKAIYHFLSTLSIFLQLKKNISFSKRLIQVNPPHR